MEAHVRQQLLSNMYFHQLQKNLYYNRFYNSSAILQCLHNKLVTNNKAIYLIGIDLNDGTLKYNILLPIVPGVFDGVGESVAVDPLSGDVFVEGRISVYGYEHTIYR
jgi:hypothetical protein